MDLTVGRQVVYLALAAAASALAGCSGKDGNLQTTCGPGTTLVGGQCVVSNDSGSSANSPDAAGGAYDAATDAGGGPGTEGAEGSAGAVEAGGSPTPEGSVGGHTGGDADAPSDPCNAMLTFMNCDNSCATKPSTWCPQSTCGKMVTALGEQGAPAYVRTPPAPGVDPACSSACPSGGFVYGLGVQVNGGGYVVKAPAPWQVIADSQTPFCPDTHSTTSSCAYFPQNASGTLYLMTNDPNAPARNILFELASSNTCP